MICPNCKRADKIQVAKGVLRYRNKFGKEVAVPRWGTQCEGCGHAFHTPEQEEMHRRERERMIKKSEEPR
jgi:Zn ribbon nucleic-acid-binding protein